MNHSHRLLALRSCSTKVVFLVVTAAIAGCSVPLPSDEAEAPRKLSEAILGGQADTAHPAVGMLWLEGTSLCSGTLIAPDVVLTAAHCIDDAHPIEGFYLGNGVPTWPLAPPSTGFKRYEVDGAVATPDFDASEGCPHTALDLALVHLAAPIADVVPVPLGTTAPAKGTTCEAVGFGLHIEQGVSSAEAKRVATEIVVDSSATMTAVKAGSGLAFSGDSGGPLLCGGQLVGTTSCHDYSVLAQGEFYSRLDLSWIDARMAEWGSSRTPKPASTTPAPSSDMAGGSDKPTTTTSGGPPPQVQAGAAAASDEPAPASSGGCSVSTTAPPQLSYGFVLAAALLLKRRSRARALG